MSTPRKRIDDPRDGFLALFGIDGDPNRELEAVKAGLDIVKAASSMSRYLDRIYGPSRGRCP